MFSINLGEVTDRLHLQRLFVTRHRKLIIRTLIQKEPPQVPVVVVALSSHPEKEALYRKLYESGTIFMTILLPS